MSKAIERPTKFIVEYKDDSGKITERWHYDLAKFRNGPVLVENLELPPRERKKRKKVVEEK